MGGRVRTDEVDGFLLDRGFQVLLTAYPTARAMLEQILSRREYQILSAEDGEEALMLLTPYTKTVK